MLFPKRYGCRFSAQQSGTEMDNTVLLLLAVSTTMLTSLLSMGHGDWSVGSPAGVLVAPGPGADRSPAAGFMSG
jgi:hypothetical protein